MSGPLGGRRALSPVILLFARPPEEHAGTCMLDGKIAAQKVNLQRTGGVEDPLLASCNRRIIHSDRSRTSISCTGSEPSPGTRISPPLAIRTGQ